MKLKCTEGEKMGSEVTYAKEPYHYWFKGNKTPREILIAMLKAAKQGWWRVVDSVHAIEISHVEYDDFCVMGGELDFKGPNTAICKDHHGRWRELSSWSGISKNLITGDTKFNVKLERHNRAVLKYGFGYHILVCEGDDDDGEYNFSKKEITLTDSDDYLHYESISAVSEIIKIGEKRIDMQIKHLKRMTEKQFNKSLEEDWHTYLAYVNKCSEWWDRYSRGEIDFEGNEIKKE